MRSLSLLFVIAVLFICRASSIAANANGECYVDVTGSLPAGWSYKIDVLNTPGDGSWQNITYGYSPSYDIPWTYYASDVTLWRNRSISFRWEIRNASFSTHSSGTFIHSAGATTYNLNLFVQSRPVITSATTATGTLGTAFTSYTITASNSPTSFGATGLPGGLSVNTGNGVISGTPTAAGTFNVTITATNSGGTGSATLTLTISKASQTIAAFTTVPGKTFGDAPFAVTVPSATSSLAVVLSVKSGPATVSGNTVTLTGVGTVVLAANQAGNASYNAASEVTTSFTVAPTPTPEPALRIEEPVGIDLVNSAIVKTFGHHLSGTASTSRVYTMRNTGGGPLTSITLTKLGSHMDDFTIVSPATDSVSAGGATTFSVLFTPTTGGTRTAEISITSSDTNNSPFIIYLSGFGIGENLDTDGDGLNDAAEFTMSALGFDWQSNQPVLVGALYSNANLANLFSRSQYDDNRAAGRADVLATPASYGLHTPSSIMDLRMDGLMVQKHGSSAVVIFQPQTTTDLAQPFTNNGAPMTNTVPMPVDKGFIRINAKPNPTPVVPN